MTKLTKKQAEQVAQIERLVVFGWSQGGLDKYRLRDSIANAKTDTELQSECPELFGAEFTDIVAMLEAHCDLDREHTPKRVF